MGIGIGAALIGGSAIGAGGSILSGLFGASAASKQADAIRYSADQGAAVVREMNNLARKDLAPFREMGVKAGSELMRMLLGGPGVDVREMTKASPLFQFQSELGMRNLNRELSARGLFGSGAGLETLARFNNQLVGEEADRLFGRLFNVTSLGENAAAKTASGNIQSGQTIAGIESNAGTGISGAIGNQYQAINQSIQSGINAIRGGVNDYVGYQMYGPLLQRLAGGVGGGGAAGSFMVNAPGGGITTYKLTGT